MRDMLCKGKRIDNGEWVEGFYALKGVEEFERHMIVVSTFNANTAGYPFYFTDYEVDPSTVCQSTGLKDKNGKLIWENDILECETYVQAECNHFLSQVEWDADCAGFIIQDSPNSFVGLDAIGRGGIYCCENIGSIFDNPELIKA